MSLSPSSNRWGTALWLVVATLSVPFALYASVFVYGDFDVYKKMTTNWVAKNYDIAGLHILHHLRVWQIHSVAAIAFVLTAPQQFVPSLRKQFPALHRFLGYTFVAAGTFCAISGIVFMVPHTEFGTFGQAMFLVVGFSLLYFLFVAVRTAREKNFQIHRKYMIRAAAMGNSVIGMRFIPTFIHKVFGVDFLLSCELATLFSPLLFLGVAELYIRAVVSQPQRRPPAKGKSLIMNSLSVQR